MELEAQFEPNGGGGGGAVDSVNGQTGTVVLDAGDLGYDDEETYTSGTVGKEISNLKVGLTDIEGTVDELPKMAEISEDEAELYIADDDGYVVAQFSDGHIQTKKFNSANVGSVNNTDSTSSLDIADPNGYVVVRFENGDLKTKNFDSSKVQKTFPIQYKFSNGNLLLSFGYNSTYDAVVVLNVGRSNDLFDFSAFCLIPKWALLDDYEVSTLTQVWISGTDMHSPFQFLATNNPDGYYSSATDPGYTGGNHTQTINDTVIQTASSRYVHYFADGVPVTTGYGKCSHFEIRWANNVQAYNCVKADGTGRTSLIEYHDMVFDGIRFVEDVSIVPTEDISMKFYEGIAAVSWGTTYTKIQFVDAVNRDIYSYTSSKLTSGNNTPSGIILTGNDHSLEMRMENIDLGKREYYTGTEGAYTSSSKAYFRLIYASPKVSMPEANAYYFRCSFRFFPTVA